MMPRSQHRTLAAGGAAPEAVMMVPPPRPASRQTASRANTLLSVAAVLATTGQKTLAWHLTGSVGLLSDAQESGVTLVSALTACRALTLGERPADRQHPFGHSKTDTCRAAWRAP